METHWRIWEIEFYWSIIWTLDINGPQTRWRVDNYPRMQSDSVYTLHVPHNRERSPNSYHRLLFLLRSVFTSKLVLLQRKWISQLLVFYGNPDDCHIHAALNEWQRQGMTSQRRCLQTEKLDKSKDRDLHCLSNHAITNLAVSGSQKLLASCREASGTGGEDPLPSLCGVEIEQRERARDQLAKIIESQLS